MGILEAVRKSFGIANKNIALLLILFCFNFIGLLVRLPFMPKTPVLPGQPLVGPGQPPLPPAQAAALMLIGLVFALIGVFFFCGVMGSIKEFIKTQKVELGNFVKYGAKYYFKIIGVWLAMLIVLFLFLLPVVVGIAIAAAVKSLAVISISIAIALIIGSIGVYLFLLLLMAPYALIADEIGPVAALKVSIAFVRKNLIKMIGLILLLALVALGMGFLVGIAMGIVAIFIKGIAGQIAVGILGSVFNAYINVVFPAALLLVYMSSKIPVDKPESV